MTAVLTAAEAEAAAESWRLVERAQAGDVDAFAAIYRRYRPFIQQYLFANMADWQVSLDLTSETFTRAFANFGRLTWQGLDVEAWLTTIAKHLMIDRKRSWYHKNVSACDEVADDRQEPGPEGNLERTVLATVDSMAVLAAIARLPASQRECLTLRVLMDHSLIETAALMGKQPHAVAVLQSRAKRAVRRHLTAEFAVDILT